MTEDRAESSSPAGPLAPPSHAVRWGVIGTGGIAAKFVDDLRGETAEPRESEVVAVGSRTVEKAAAFADQHGIATSHGSYSALVNDPAVEAVYVATPHTGHFDAGMAAIEAGKAVLIEKPFTMDADQAQRLVDAARAQGVFLMEAMWTRFLPHVRALREMLADGVIGDVVSVIADHGQHFEFDPTHRLFDPDLGGGALLDLGVYPISFCSMILGRPDKVTATSTPAFTGVDSTTSALLEYHSGAHGVVHATLASRSATTAVVNGTRGRVELGSPFYAPGGLTLHLHKSPAQHLEFPLDGHGKGMRFEASEVARCMRAGLSESPQMPLAETVEIMATMDEIRRQIGLVYPGE